MAKIVCGPNLNKLQEIVYAALPMGKFWFKKKSSPTMKLKLGPKSSLGKIKFYDANVEVEVSHVDIKRKWVYFGGHVLVSGNTKLQVAGKLTVDSNLRTSRGELYLVT